LAACSTRCCLEQIERSRSAPAPGAPLVLQLLHLYGVQFNVLFFSIGYWTRATDTTVGVVFAAPNMVRSPCVLPPFVHQPPGFHFDLMSHLLGEWLAVLWVAAAWGCYARLACGDTRSVLRKVTQFAGFVAGMISAVVGVQRAAELALRSAFGLGTSLAAALADNFDLFPARQFGLVAMLVYDIWLMTEAPATPLGQQGTELTTMALAAVVLGVPFYIAVVQLVHGSIESAVTGSPYPNDNLAASLVLLISGLVHPFVAFELGQRTTTDVPVGLRRGFVLAGFAAGALAGAIGAAIALYLLITAQLGSPVSAGWQVNARMGAVVFLVGGFVAGNHSWRTNG
jgi:hypothetical protein